MQAALGKPLEQERRGSSNPAIVFGGACGLSLALSITIILTTIILTIVYWGYIGIREKTMDPDPTYGDGNLKGDPSAQEGRLMT